MLLSVPLVHALLVVPHTPFTGIGSEHDAVVPPFDPVQFQRYWVPESAMLSSVPVVQALLVAPQAPFTLKFAEQVASPPPYDPVQSQFHGPLPVTEVGVPALQRLVVGVEVNDPPFDDPHTPVTGSVVVILYFITCKPLARDVQMTYAVPVPLSKDMLTSLFVRLLV